LSVNEEIFSVSEQNFPIDGENKYAVDAFFSIDRQNLSAVELIFLIDAFKSGNCRENGLNREQNRTNSAHRHRKQALGRSHLQQKPDETE
jgi:hypothetical protein